MINKERKKAALVAAGMLAGAGMFSMGAAQAADPVAARDLPPELRQLVQAVLTQPQAAPGVVFGSPVAFGARTGDYFFGINGSTAEQGNDFIGDVDVDGSMVAGFGIGDPVNAIGAEIAFNVISLTDSFGDSGALSFKFHRNVGDRGAIAVGTENTIAWGDAQDVVDATTSTEFISYSHYFDAGANGMMITVGAGDGRLGQSDDPEDFAPFVALGYNLTRQLSAIADYSGEQVSLGLSFVPWRDVPFSILVGATDLTEERSDTEMAIAVGYSGTY